MSLSDEKYILLTTFRRDGTPVSTPVWIVEFGDGQLGFWTSSESGKAKRLAHTARVTAQPSDGRGRVKPGTEPIDATAHLVGGDEFAAIRAQVVAKYGFMTKVTKAIGGVLGTVRRKRLPYGDVGVVITPAG